MKANSAAMPMTSAFTPFSMFSLPSVPVMVFSLAMEIGAVSAPPRSSSDSSRASVCGEAGGQEAVAEHDPGWSRR